MGLKVTTGCTAPAKLRKPPVSLYLNSHTCIFFKPQLTQCASSPPFTLHRCSHLYHSTASSLQDPHPCLLIPISPHLTLIFASLLQPSYTYIPTPTSLHLLFTTPSLPQSPHPVLTPASSHLYRHVCTLTPAVFCTYVLCIMFTCFIMVSGSWIHEIGYLKLDN